MSGGESASDHAKWRLEHPYEAAVQILKAAVANPFAPVGLLSFAEAAAVLTALGEPLSDDEA